MKHNYLYLLLIILLFPSQAQAHKIHVFAWVSGNSVTVESGFSGNRPLIKGTVRVSNVQTAELLLQGTGDNKGIFTFEIPATVKENAVDMLITVTGGEGHQSEWLLSATEYLAETNGENIPQQRTLNNVELERMFKKILETELAPIKRSLAKASEQKPGFRDIMGGIGYLLGLAGLITWLKNRKSSDSQQG
jgi:nickel transport protein